MGVINRECPKCGNEQAHVSFDPVFNSMGMTCNLCGYNWQLKPLDVLREDKERQQAARADTATSDRTGETGWLIEIADGSSPMWWAASPDPRALGGFDPDSLKATRFAREKDAKDMATFLHVKGAIAFQGIGKIQITEHSWSDNPTGLGNSAMRLDFYVDPLRCPHGYRRADLDDGSSICDLCSAPSEDPDANQN